MKKQQHAFQSYLVVGDGTAQTEKIKEICEQFGIDIEKNSPDIQIISPQKSSIGIDDIRQLKKYIYQKPVRNDVKIVLVESADTLTPEAQNSFLKLLEEPPSHAVFILKSRSHKSFLPTVLSRLTIIQVGFSKMEMGNIQGKDLNDLILYFTQHPEPQKLLEEEMISFATLLKQNIQKEDSFYERKNITDTIEKLNKAKKMIHANVNTTQVLIALAISLKSKKFSL